MQMIKTENEKRLEDENFALKMKVRKMEFFHSQLITDYEIVICQLKQKLAQMEKETV